MISQETIATLYGAEVHDRGDEKVGTVGQVFAAEEAGQPAWVSVRTGWFGQRESLVPIEKAQWEGDHHLRVPYDKAQIKAAPHVDTEVNEPIASSELAGLYQHYNMGVPQRPAEGERGREGQVAEGQGAGGQGAEGQAEHRPGGLREAMTLSEEQMHVGTERQEVGTARLHKYVVTEHVQTTVPVSHEEVHLEREPISADANRDRPYAGADIGEADQEVVLHAERPVVAKETVPVERVRLDMDMVSEQETVGGDLRKERVEADLPEHERHAA